MQSGGVMQRIHANDNTLLLRCSSFADLIDYNCRGSRVTTVAGLWYAKESCRGRQFLRYVAHKVGEDYQSNNGQW